MQVLITGANRGVGLALVNEYAHRGARVFAACRQPERADSLRSLRAEHGDRIIPLRLDVTSRTQVDACHEVVRQHTGSLDRLINNAGILHPVDSFRDITDGDLMESFAVNTWAPLRMIQRFEALLENGDSPRVVNITGPTPPITQLPQRGNQTYLASRYAHNALTEMVALELADKGIITVGLWPGYVRTDMNGMAPEATPSEEAIPLAVAVIESLTPEHNGSCLLPNGETYAW